MGIKCGADLIKYEELDLVRRFGKVGRHYYRVCRGEDDSHVNPHRVRKSIGAEETFSEDIEDIEAMKAELVLIAERIFDYMKRKENYGRTLTLKAKSVDFQTFTRSKTFISELKNLDDILRGVFDLLSANVKDFKKVRLLGLSVSNLTKEQMLDGIQLEIDFQIDLDL